MILIVGGTGDLGSATTEKLLAQRKAVRVMTRTPAKAAALQAMGAEIVQGDLRDPASLRRACAGVEQVVASAHSIFGRGLEASKYVDLQGHKDLVDAARGAGCQQFVYISLQGIESNPTPFARFKHEVEHYLKDSGLRYTILRPTAFMETHAHTMIGQPILETGKVTLFGEGHSPRNFVAVDDIVVFVLLALEGRAEGAIVEIGGPENWTNMEVVTLYEQLAGRKAKVSHVPRGVLRVMSGVLRPFHPGLSQVMQFSLWADTTDQTFDASETLKRYPTASSLTGLEEWMQARVAGKAAVTVRTA